MNTGFFRHLFAVLISGGLFAFPPNAAADPFEQLGVARPRTVKPAPDIELKNLEGKPVNLSQFRGKPVLINFWATWCGPCKMELPSLQRLHESSKSNGEIQILAVAIDRFNIDRVHEFAQSFNLTFPILLDQDRQAQKDYFIRGLPTSYLVDAEGRLRGFISGARHWDSPQAKEMFKELKPSGK